MKFKLILCVGFLGVTAFANASAAERHDMFKFRCPEELYRTSIDPDALNNLVDHSERKPQIQQMRKKLLAWMAAVNDTDLLPEFKAVVRDGGVTEQTPRGKGYLKAKAAEPVAE